MRIGMVALAPNMESGTFLSTCTGVAKAAARSQFLSGPIVRAERGAFFMASHASQICGTWKSLPAVWVCRCGFEVVSLSIMKTANIADLRNNFRVIASWISEGETVEIKKRGHPFATLIPSAQAARAMPQIDFAGRLKKIWGDRVFSDQEVAEMRMAEHEGEEG